MATISEVSPYILNSDASYFTLTLTGTGFDTLPSGSTVSLENDEGELTTPTYIVDSPTSLTATYNLSVPEGVYDVSIYDNTGSLSAKLSTSLLSTTLIVDEASVFSVTGKHATDLDIFNSQNLISLYLGIPLDDLSGLSTQDQNLIKQGTAHQAVHFNEHSEEVSTTELNLPAGVTSISQGDISMTFGAGGASASEVVSLISPIAFRLLSRLSWLKGKTIRPVQEYDLESTTPWSRVVDLNAYAFYPPITRPYPAPDPYTMSTDIEVP